MRKEARLPLSSLTAGQACTLSFQPRAHWPFAAASGRSLPPGRARQQGRACPGAGAARSLRLQRVAAWLVGAVGKRPEGRVRPDPYFISGARTAEKDAKYSRHGVRGKVPSRVAKAEMSGGWV